MISGSITYSGSVNYAATNATFGNQIKPIAEMSQVEKVGLATKIANGAINASETTSLCTDPKLATEFLENVEVQSILLTAIVKGQDIGHDLIQAMKDPNYVFSIRSENKETLMRNMFPSIEAVLHNQPKMAFIVNFFNHELRIMDAIGMDAIMKAYDAGEIDSCDVLSRPVLQCVRGLYQKKLFSLENRINQVNSALDVSATDLTFLQNQLSKMDPSDPNKMTLQEKYDAGIIANGGLLRDLLRAQIEVKECSKEIIRLKDIIHDLDRYKAWFFKINQDQV